MECNKFKMQDHIMILHCWPWLRTPHTLRGGRTGRAQYPPAWPSKMSARSSPRALSSRYCPTVPKHVAQLLPGHGPTLATPTSRLSKRKKKLILNLPTTAAICTPALPMTDHADDAIHPAALHAVATVIAELGSPGQSRATLRYRRRQRPRVSNR